MSIDVNWSKLAGGEEKVRQFIHDKFQQVTLPRFIRSVKVHSFDFGSATPDIEIKDICDPLPDFYDDDDDDNQDDDSHPGDDVDQDEEEAKTLRDRRHRPRELAAEQKNQRPPAHADPRLSSASRTGLALGEPLGNPLSRAPTPAIPGGTSNMSYFHLPLGAGLSGTTTPFAAVAGAQFQNGWHDHHQQSHHADPPQTPLRNHSASISSNTPPSSTDLDSRPQSQHQHDAAMQTADDDFSDSSPSTPPIREASPEDIQIVSHVRYSGDIKMVLTAEINLDYPMPSFVGIPLKLTVTGLTFDGVAILAYIKKRAHFCFLSPDDADALIGSDGGDGRLADDQTAVSGNRRPAAGGLLEEIKVESEIGQKEHGKQVLKNVGKVEKFILEQVRRIFEDEFVYPSFWTFLV
ncbi:hypothetical protein IWX90DRAFT_139467 [Phyllosticta citrichinensis]|uniref:Mitochondrial distribution and morphology protein 12 n=1 Tax=Phyllosticta citrichinensis TaxID=1130410 RepID=A0ABR1XZ30_9PEZI